MTKYTAAVRSASLVLSLGAALLTFDATSPADAHSYEFHTGKLTTHQVPCPTLCTTGPLTGGLAGTMDWTMTSMNSTPNPDVVILIGVLSVTTSDGSMSGPDVTLWNLSTGQFVDNTTFTSGTGSFAGAKGDLFLVGKFDLAGGTGASDYRAIVKKP